jgi:hypothetical protein
MMLFKAARLSTTAGNSTAPSEPARGPGLPGGAAAIEHRAADSARQASP